MEEITTEEDFFGTYYEGLTKILAEVQMKIDHNEQVQNIDLSRPPQPLYKDNTSVEKCPLHNWLVKGGIGYSPRIDGTYSMYAPECSGCEHGIKETKKINDKSEAEMKAIESYKTDWIKKYGRLPKGVE